MFYEIVVLKGSRKFPGKHPWWCILLNFINKSTPPLMFSYEFSPIFKDSYFTKHLRTAVSEIIQESSRDSFRFQRSNHSKEL